MKRYGPERRQRPRRADDRRERERAITRLEEALETVRQAGEPAAGTSHYGHRGSSSAEWNAPDQARQGWRDLYEAKRREIHRLADKINAALGRKDPGPSKARARCRQCGWGLRPQANVCDGCGSSDVERTAGTPGETKVSTS